MQSARKTKTSFCLDVFARLVVEADTLLHAEAGHCLGERDAESVTCFASFLFALLD